MQSIVITIMFAIAVGLMMFALVMAIDLNKLINKEVENKND